MFNSIESPKKTFISTEKHGKKENSDLLDNDKNAVFCAVCDSSDIEIIPEEDKVIAYGAFALMDVPMLLNRVSNTYQCQQCYHEW